MSCSSEKLLRTVVGGTRIVSEKRARSAVKVKVSMLEFFGHQDQLKEAVGL